MAYLKKMFKNQFHCSTLNQRNFPKFNPSDTATTSDHFSSPGHCRIQTGKGHNSRLQLQNETEQNGTSLFATVRHFGAVRLSQDVALPRGQPREGENRRRGGQRRRDATRPQDARRQRETRSTRYVHQLRFGFVSPF